MFRIQHPCLVTWAGVVGVYVRACLKRAVLVAGWCLQAWKNHSFYGRGNSGISRSGTILRLSTSPHSLLNWSQWNLYQSIDKAKNERVVEVSPPETTQDAVWKAKTSQKFDKLTYLSHVFTIFSANFLLSKKWIAPVCSWEFSGQERYVIFMKNKENHG